jgi:hypothetical protein
MLLIQQLIGGQVPDFVFLMNCHVSGSMGRVDS